MSASYRNTIIDYLGQINGYVTGRDISLALGIPYKATIDALNALHRMARVSRRGEKASATWGSAKLTKCSLCDAGWEHLAKVWFGTANDG